MYKIVYARQALKDIKNLKAVRLDFKAKALIEIIMKLNMKVSLKLSGCGHIMAV